MTTTSASDTTTNEPAVATAGPTGGLAPAQDDAGSVGLDAF